MRRSSDEIAGRQNWLLIMEDETYRDDLSRARLASGNHSSPSGVRSLQLSARQNMDVEVVESALGF